MAPAVGVRRGLTVAWVAAAVAGAVVACSQQAQPPERPVRTTASPTVPRSSDPGPPLHTERTRSPYRLVDSRIPMPRKRTDEMAAYGRRHYGRPLTAIDPKVVVLHFTEGGPASETIAYFAQDRPSAGEYPQVCAHYVVDQDGTVHLVVPPTTPCRHTIGLNDVAVGVEFVQSSRGRGPAWADRQVLARTAQVEAGLALVRELQGRYGIATEDVIGHAEANASRYFHDRTGQRNDHGDWLRADAAAFRRRL